MELRNDGAKLRSMDVLMKKRAITLGQVKSVCKKAQLL